MKTKMLKQHFNAIAGAIDSIPTGQGQKQIISATIANVLRVYNPAFSRERFISASTKTPLDGRDDLVDYVMERLAPPVDNNLDSLGAKMAVLMRASNITSMKNSKFSFTLN